MQNNPWIIKQEPPRKQLTKKVVPWGDIFVCSFMMTLGFIFMLSLWNGFIFGGLSPVIKSLIHLASYIYPITGLFEYSMLSFLLKMAQEGNPSIVLLKEQILEFSNKPKEYWFVSLYNNHIKTVYAVAFISLIYLNGFIISSYLIAIAFIVSELARNILQKVAKELK